MVFRLDLLLTPYLLVLGFHLHLHKPVLSLLTLSCRLWNIVRKLWKLVIVCGSSTRKLLLLLHISHHFLLHFIHVGILSSLGCQNIHRFKIECTHPSHECLFKAFLHVAFLAVISRNLRVSVLKPLPQLLDLFYVIRRNRLNFCLYWLLEFLFILLYFPNSMFLVPCLPNTFLHQHTMVFSFRLQENLRMFLPVSVSLKCIEALHLQRSDPSDRFTLTRPDCHHLAPYLVLLRHFCLLDKTFSQLFNFVLLKWKHCCAPAALPLDYLGLVNW